MGASSSGLRLRTTLRLQRRRWIASPLFAGFVLLCAAWRAAAEPVEPALAELKLIELDAIVVTAQTRGIVPLFVAFTLRSSNRFDRDGEIVNLFPLPPVPRSGRLVLMNGRHLVGEFGTRKQSAPATGFDQHLEELGLRPGDKIVAVDGEEVAGMKHSRFQKWRTESGDVGSVAHVVVVGEDNVFRSVHIRRMSGKAYQRHRDRAFNKIPTTPAPASTQAAPSAPTSAPGS